jgi:hypothetical protein
MMPFGVGPSVKFVVVAGLAALLAGPAPAAQVVGPPPPQEYKVHIRYRIRAARSERAAQFRRMLDYFRSLGFQPDEDPENAIEDPELVTMTGTVPSASARKLLDEPHVRRILLLPADYEPPAEADTPAKLQIELERALTPARQALLAGQVRGLLEEMGFRPAVGFDDRGHTRLVGTVPAGRLDALLSDLRWQAGGWLVPEVPVPALPAPVNAVWPVRVIEVTPEPAGVPPAREPAAPAEVPQGQEFLQKVTPDLRALAAQEGQAGKPIRMDVILSTTPAPDAAAWERPLRDAIEGLVIEGRLGPVVSVLAAPEQAAGLAALPAVATVRLPRPAVRPVPQPEDKPLDTRELLQTTGLERIRQFGYRGRGVRLAVVDSDFRGWEQFVGKELPATTRLVDVTAERSRDVLPDPFPGDPQGIGQGTQAALAAAVAAPEATLTLIRIDPAAPYQLYEVATYVAGAPARSPSLNQRSEQLTAEVDELRSRRDALLEERRAVLNNFSQEPAFVQRREAYFKAEAQLRKDERALQQRQARYLALVGDLQGLGGTHVVANGLVWDEGYPVDGGSVLTRLFEDGLCRRTVWVQAVGNTRGQSWGGVFRGADGVLQFAAPGTPPPPGRWTSELNFLGWQTLKGESSPDLPAKATVRVTLQWREVHDPEFLRRGEDLYREPLANLRVLVLRQRDPTGKQLPTDDLEVVARSAGLPQRIDNEPASAVYEQIVEFTVDPAGRYVLRVEGRVPESPRPTSVPTLPVLQQGWELRPRLFLNVLDEASRRAGRAVFLDYVSENGALGMPADSRYLLVIGAAGPNGAPRPYSVRGTALGLELRPRPDALAVDGVTLGEPAAFGTAPATGLAAGMAAVALGSGPSQNAFFRQLQVSPGALLRMP